MKRNINMNIRKAPGIIFNIMLFTAVCILMSLLNRAEVRADGPGSSSVDHNITVSVDPVGSGTTTPDHASESNDALITLIASPNAGYEFVEWTTETPGVSITNPSSAGGAHFDMVDYDVVITAHFRAITPAAPTASSGGGKSEPKEPEEPDPKTTQGYFFATVTDQVNAMLARLLASANDPAALAGLKAKGITIDAGVWISFNKETAATIDKAIKQGIPVTINYLYKGNKKTIYIPSGFPYGLEDMCDDNGYVGFEYIYASVINGKLIEKNSARS